MLSYFVLLIHYIWQPTTMDGKACTGLNMGFFILVEQNRSTLFWSTWLLLHPAPREYLQQQCVKSALQELAPDIDVVAISTHSYWVAFGYISSSSSTSAASRMLQNGTNHATNRNKVYYWLHIQAKMDCSSFGMPRADPSILVLLMLFDVSQNQTIKQERSNKISFTLAYKEMKYNVCCFLKWEWGASNALWITIIMCCGWCCLDVARHVSFASLW